MTAPDALAVLTRADQRWATRNHDDPAPAEYLRALLTALAPLLQPGAAAVDLDQATELEPLRTELAEVRRDAETWRERSDGWQGDANQYGSERDEARQKLVDTTTALDEARAERDTAQAQLADLQREFRDANSHRVVAEQLRDERNTACDAYTAARRDLNAATDHNTRLTDDLNNTAALLAINHNRIATLIATITGAPMDPTRDPGEQVQHAVDLVIAAAEVIDQRQADGKHVCEWPRNPRTGHIGKCECGKPFPKTAKTGLANATKGAA